MKKLIFALAFLGFTFHMHSQAPLSEIMQSENWTTISSRQLAKLNLEHNKYDLVLMPKEKVGTFWGDVMKLDSLNNYRNYSAMRCGTPPYVDYEIEGKWNVVNDTLCIDIQSAILDCTYEEEKCKKYEQEFLVLKEETKIRYAIEVVNDSIIVGMKLELE